jgi:hypothetical protein
LVLYVIKRLGPTKFSGVVVKQEDVANVQPPFQGGTPVGTRVSAVAADWSTSEHTQQPTEQILIRRRDGIAIWAYPQLKAKMTVRAGNTSVGPETRDPKTDCLKSTKGNTPIAGEYKEAEEKILGFRAIKAVFKSSDRTQTNWYAPDLGCISLQAFMEQGGQTYLVRAKEVIPGPPASSYFEAPKGLQEMSPSGVGMARMKYFLKAKGLNDQQMETEIQGFLAKMPADAKARLDQQDAQYEAAKVKP